jgi:DNA-binding transcriptional ArsR family regulator
MLRDSRLSFRARGVLAHLLSHNDGWHCTSDDLVRAGTEGRDAIRAALRELREAGYVEIRRQQDDRGRWTTETMVYDEPIIEITDKQPAAAAPRAVARGKHAAAPAAGSTPTSKRRHVRESGIVCWTDEDAAHAAGLEAKTPPDLLATAVTELHKRAVDPLPGLVARQLERLQKQQAAGGPPGRKKIGHRLTEGKWSGFESQDYNDGIGPNGRF